MESRTTGAICLGSNNFNGRYSCYSLVTGEIISRRNWTELPVPVDVISRLKEMSNDLYSNIDEIGDQEENETEYHQDENTFEDKIVRDNEEEKSQKGGDEGEDEDSTTNSSIDNQQPSRVNEEHEYELVQDNEEERNQDEQDKTNKKDHSEVNEEERLVEEEMNREESEVNIHPRESQEPNEINIKDQKGYNLRPNRKLNYSHRFALLLVHAGVRKWGEKAKEAVREELRTLKKEEVFKEIRNPTSEQVKKALMIHCFVVEKRDGRIKAREVADGRSQVRYTEEETYSPTVKLESIMLNAFIDAHEGRYVATVDIKGAFLKAKVPKEMELIVKMSGELSQIMCEINPTLKPDANGIVYLKCIKALYGHIEAARLFYNDLNKNIQEKMNFQQN